MIDKKNINNKEANTCIPNNTKPIFNFLLLCFLVRDIITPLSMNFSISLPLLLFNQCYLFLFQNEKRRISIQRYSQVYPSAVKPSTEASKLM